MRCQMWLENGILVYLTLINVDLDLYIWSRFINTRSGAHFARPTPCLVTIIYKVVVR